MKYKSLDMKYSVLCSTLISLYLTNIVATDTTMDEYETSSNTYVFNLTSQLKFSCNITKYPTAEIRWVKDGVDITAGIAKGRFKGHDLIIDKAMVEDAGNYSCTRFVGDTIVWSRYFFVESRPFIKLVTNVNVVEGEKLSIECTVLGKPTPVVAWRVGNMTYNMSEDRIELLPFGEVDNALFIINDVKMSDRNEYFCLAKSPSEDDYSVVKKTMVRVKDKLAALWPFLGICLEVFVLCAVILIYEKKRNKAELEESDTDQSPDQKNTPDHGKDSDIRHRK